MAYTPTVWETGDVITAEKLNKAEQGISDANGLICKITVDDESYVADKTFSEICDALDNAKPVRFIYDDNDEVYEELYVCQYIPETVSPLGTLPASLKMKSLPTIDSSAVRGLIIEWYKESGTETITVTSVRYPSIG